MAVVIVAVTTVVAFGGSDIGTRVARPAERGYSAAAIRAAGERGGMLLNVGTNFTAAHNQTMGDAIALWNAHRWQGHNYPSISACMGDVGPNSVWMLLIGTAGTIYAAGGTVSGGIIGGAIIPGGISYIGYAAMITCMSQGCY